MNNISINYLQAVFKRLPVPDGSVPIYCAPLPAYIDDLITLHRAIKMNDGKPFTGYIKKEIWFKCEMTANGYEWHIESIAGIKMRDIK